MRDKLKLNYLKDKIEFSRTYFEENNTRFNKFKSMVFDTSLDAKMISALNLTSRPVLEFNILWAFVSRILGDFSKQEPSVKVDQTESNMRPDPQMIEFFRGHFLALLDHANREQMQSKVLKDTIAGGFSGIKIYTKYLNPMSFQQRICLEKIFDPTMMGFDPNARMPHKGDGSFCYSLAPMPRRIFEEKYGKRKVSSIDFTGRFGGYSWNFYGEDKEEYVLLVEVFEKEVVGRTIVQLSNGDVMFKSQYDKLRKFYETEFIGIGVLPEIVGSPRRTEIESISRYVLCEDEILEQMSTDYRYLPMVFIDGNSEMLHRTMSGGTYVQKTLPIVYHLEGTQGLKNYAGSSLANELENIDQNKYRVPIEGIPAQYQDAYTQLQMPNVLVYNQLHPENKDIKLDPPEPLPRVAPPPELYNTFFGCDQIAQTTMGLYDAALGINDNQLSGRAIDKASIVSNSVIQPYIENYVAGLTQVFHVCLDLIPKYYKGERQLPVKMSSKETEYVKVNGQEGLNLDVNPYDYGVIVKPGVNYELQKQQSFQLTLELMKVLPMMAEFIQTTPEGMQFLFDNIDLLGKEGLEQQIEQFTKQKQQQMAEEREIAKQQAMNQINPLQLKQQELAIKQKNEDARNRIDESKVAVQKTEADTKRMQAYTDMGISMSQHELEKAKHQADLTDSEIANVIQYLQMQDQREMNKAAMRPNNQQ